MYQIIFSFALISLNCPVKLSNVMSALKGRTYFTPQEPSRSDNTISSKQLSDRVITDSKGKCSSIAESSTSNSCDTDSDFSFSSGAPATSRIEFQRPWCPGKFMASLIPHALDPIYDWLDPRTCDQFAGNYGGISVIVGEMDGPVFCSAGPNPRIYSNYTIIRGLSVNEPIYARVNDPVKNVVFAAAAGPIFYPEGLVYYISVAKEVSKLPQLC